MAFPAFMASNIGCRPMMRLDCFGLGGDGLNLLFIAAKITHQSSPSSIMSLIFWIAARERESVIRCSFAI